MLLSKLRSGSVGRVQSARSVPCRPARANGPVRCSHLPLCSSTASDVGHDVEIGAGCSSSAGRACPRSTASATDACCSNSSSSSLTKTNSLGSRLDALRASITTGFVVLPSGLFAAFSLLPGGSGRDGGRDGGSGSGGGRGGGDGNGPHSGGEGPSGNAPLFDLAAVDEAAAVDDDASEASGDKLDGIWRGLITPSDALEDVPGERSGSHRCVEIVIEGWPEVGGQSLPNKKDLQELFTVMEGHVFDEQDLVDDRRKLELQFPDYITTVDVRAEYVDEKSNHQRVIYKFSPLQYKGINSVEIQGADLMPQATKEEIIAKVLPKHSPYDVDVGIMDKLRECVENWYHEKGLPFCYVGYIDGMEEGTLRAHVTEAKINDVSVRFERPGPDGDYIQIDEGDIVPADKIIEAAGFQKGQHYHMDDGLDAMNSVYACGLFEDINIEPEQDPTDPTKINIKIKVEEVEPRSMEMNLDWAFQMKAGLPRLTRQSLVPGGSVEITHENLFGDAQSLTASLSSSDWRNPAADLGVEVSYSEPFYKPNTTRNAQLFSTRKVSPVFTGGSDAEVPPVYVDRFGLKGWTSFAGGEDDKVEHALMLQQVGTTDDNGQPVIMGTKAARGYYADRGPQTTVSESGRDTSLSYQGFARLDNVQFVNGNQLGRRATLQVDQGLNLRIPLPGGRSFGLTGGVFNRCQASYTRFMQLPGIRPLTEEEVWVKRKAPVTLVLHGKAGYCVGDMGSYDYFTLGGPHSVRGYSHGELGAARRMVEAAAEVRVPLRNFGLGNGTVYSFLEAGSDLGSSKALQGNPTEYYRKAGHGHSLGVGIKVLGACRFEVARDCNAGTNNVLVNWGERF